MGNAMKLIDKKKLENIPLGIEVNEILLPHHAQSIIPFNTSFITIEPGMTTPVDCHLVKEMWLIVAGIGLLTCDKKTSEIKEKDAIYFNSMQEHAVKNTGDSRLEIISIWWKS